MSDDLHGPFPTIPTKLPVSDAFDELHALETPSKQLKQSPTNHDRPTSHDRILHDESFPTRVPVNGTRFPLYDPCLTFELDGSDSADESGIEETFSLTERNV